MANLAILCVCCPCTIAYCIAGNTVIAIKSLLGHTGGESVSNYDQCDAADIETLNASEPSEVLVSTPR